MEKVLLTKIMTVKELLIYLIFCNDAILTQCQLIYHQDRCHNDRETDLLIKMMRELHVEFSSCRQRSSETERLLLDRITKMEADFAVYRDESLDMQKRLEEKLKRHLKPIGRYRRS